MKLVWANSLNEMQKLIAKKSTKLFLLTAGILPFILMLLIEKLIFADWMALPSENIQYSILDLFVKVLLPIFTFLAAAELFTAEGERGTLLPVRPISRFELFISKTMSIGIVIGLQLGLCWIGVTTGSLVMTRSFESAKTIELFAAFLLSWLPLLSLTCVAVLVALLVKSSVACITALILVYLGMIVLPYVFPNLLFMLPSSYLDWYVQWLGNASFKWVIQSVLYMCSFITMFLAISYSIFYRKEA